MREILSPSIDPFVGFLNAHGLCVHACVWALACACTEATGRHQALLYDSQSCSFEVGSLAEPQSPHILVRVAASKP